MIASQAHFGDEEIYDPVKWPKKYGQRLPLCVSLTTQEPAPAHPFGFVFRQKIDCSLIISDKVIQKHFRLVGPTEKWGYLLSEKAAVCTYIV